MKNKKEILVLVSGSPLSGKSTLIEKICSNFPDDSVIISTDETRKKLTGKYSDYSKEKEMWDTVLSSIDKELKLGKVVFLDSTLRQKWIRDNFFDRYKKHKIYFIAFEKTSMKRLMQRNISRASKSLTVEKMLKLWKEYENPTDEELSKFSSWTRIKIQYTEKDIEEIVKNITNERGNTK
jgi:predicted kinase